MKHFISLAAAAATLLLAASCSIKEDRIQCQAPVCVTVVNDMEITQGPITTKAVESVSTDGVTQNF